MKLRWGRIIFALFILVVIIGVIVYFVFFNKKEVEEEEPGVVENPTPVEEKKLQILDLESDSRPISVMINNHKTAQPLQTGLNDAYLVYEIVVEGGITRMLAVFKDADTEIIGTVRSSRHYFLDYAQENDAVYVHYGWSPQAEEDIYNLGINNINGMVDGSPFWRDTSLDVPTEHTVYTSIEDLEQSIENKRYRITSEEDTLLKYSIDEIDFSTYEGAIKADEIEIEYSSYQTNNFIYDEVNKVYKKYSNGEERKDYVTGENFTAKNIITYQVSNYSMDAKGRQEIENIGKGEGYLISNGYAVPITWEKDAPSRQTVYKFLNGEEITVNDGNTYIQIQPKNKNIEILPKMS